MLLRNWPNASIYWHFTDGSASWLLAVLTSIEWPNATKKLAGKEDSA